MTIEQIMALVGRSSENPKRYRETLESTGIDALGRALDELVNQTEETKY